MNDSAGGDSASFFETYTTYIRGLDGGNNTANANVNGGQFYSGYDEGNPHAHAPGDGTGHYNSRHQSAQGNLYDEVAPESFYQQFYPQQADNYNYNYNNYDNYNNYNYNYDDKYISLSTDDSIQLSKDDIWDIFHILQKRLGFQLDSAKNMYEHFMVQLESRASRMSASDSLLSLHSDYIGGEHSNYRKWYFAAQLDLDDEVGFKNVKKSNIKFKKINKKKSRQAKDGPLKYSLEELDNINSLYAAEFKWKKKMSTFTRTELVYQIALYLLIWGEANQIRFVPECLCFIYKCASDYIFSVPIEEISKQAPLQENDYLDRVITPLYNYIRDQQFEKKNGKYYRLERDHSKIIGYDDVNQLFWYPEGIKRIITINGIKFIDIPKDQRFLQLGDVKWKKVFYKTYYEYRSWFHLATNFSRIWIIHLSVFWIYTCFNSPTIYTPNYIQLLNNPPTPQARWSAIALAGSIASAIYLIAVFAEMMFVPKQWPGREHCRGKVIIGLLAFIINFAPSVYVFWYIPFNVYSKSAYIVSIVQFAIAMITVLIFSFKPLGGLFGSYLEKGKRKYISSQTFTASFPRLRGRSKLLSYSLWISVFAAKFIESYFFLTLSLRDPIRDLSVMVMTRCKGEAFFGNFLCKQQARFTLVLIYLTDLILFFLDTYLWYIICNCIFSVGLSFTLGISILSPWRNVFTRLPQRIKTKMISKMENDTAASMLEFSVSKLWNGIVLNMYQEHLLSRDHAYNLLYKLSDDSGQYDVVVTEPTFFLNQDDSSQTISRYFLPGSEAERRITFFAHSISTPLPDPLPAESMPTFTVLIPHYSEKILLSLKDVIKEDGDSKISLLEYLKELHKNEWSNFVFDTKEMTKMKCATPDLEEKGTKVQVPPLSAFNEGETKKLKERVEDIPYYCIGFKDSNTDLILRTRKWASLRTQTLYRTVSGFMNYMLAIKLMIYVENCDVYEFGDVLSDPTLTWIANKKFQLLVSMQRYNKFTDAEFESVKTLLTEFPDLKIATLEEVPPSKEGEDPTYYSCLLAVKQNEPVSILGEIKPNLETVYRIKLSGNPILGDGKSDNQNHALIFYRGEYIQVIDANQDMYIEECLKIRSVLAEFEELNTALVDPYQPGYLYTEDDPVAIVGAREHIFSEMIGVLGDVAAGKEQTFGTLFARTLAEIGGKLHYGHPDFLNAIFMTTRGGISKAQKGLHLNEDIYAGMNAVCRGGRIKHSDFFQCGKGRDLGFSSILNFTSKIGGGMGEQMLSREYFYLGTQLPLDKFLSFYYAHPGFHINNLFIILSVQLFMMVLLNLGSLTHESVICMYNKDIPFTDLQKPIGCYNLQPVLDWVTRFVLSIFICFFISFAPLLVQELSERGLYKAVSRFFRHLLCWSPIFEVFVCQIYSNSLKSDFTFGGAHYIGTGRGFATKRISFTELYTRYAGTSIYSGSRLFLVLLFATTSMWQPALLWFWVTAASMCLSPFFFNPHQFSFFDYFLDYRNFIRWLSRGNAKHHNLSWITFTRASRSKFTGLKKRALGEEHKQLELVHKASFANSFFTEVIFPLIQAFCAFIGYTFINAQNGVQNPVLINSVARMILLVLIPIALNMIILMVIFPFSCIAGPILNFCCSKTPKILAGFAHGCGVLIHIIMFEVLWMLEGWNFRRSLSAFICAIFFQRVIFQIVKVCFLTRELKEDYASRAWWSGAWVKSGVGSLGLTQPFREAIVKTVEMSLFAADFVLGHCLFFVLTPFVLIPYIDKLHSSMLFWLGPKVQYRRGIQSLANQSRRRRRVLRYCFMYFFMICFFASLIIAPAIGSNYVPVIRDSVNNGFITSLIQPNHQDNNDTGIKAPKTILTTTPEFVRYSTYPF
ncbi:hypothetical protein PACTADRAFT_75139 [Pachysolen tannophilus NRRL Y-2460]|uniref:1,3-beta-glucan synthase n=1 Tax=Pachysolen tannophilus NRRL Y-2460 TaxID=669874 RepID=A0A1E4TW37_PACTA|nr:hypothetical protein PACTADRAFT_75139 [Pachysolen tannophilus NRRL Y-2460]